MFDINNEKKVITIVVVGLNNSGKTVFTNSFRNIYEGTVPGVGFNEIIGEQVNVQDKQINIRIIDMPGHTNRTIQWREKIMEADAIICVIDSDDVERFEEAKICCHEFLKMAL